MNPRRLLLLALLLVSARVVQAQQTNFVAPGETILLGPNGAMRIQVQGGTLQLGNQTFTTNPSARRAPATNGPVRLFWDAPRPFSIPPDPVILALRVTAPPDQVTLPDGLPLPVGFSARLIHKGPLVFEIDGNLHSGTVFTYQISGPPGFQQLTNVTVNVGTRTFTAPPFAFAIQDPVPVPASAVPTAEAEFIGTGPWYVGQSATLRLRVIDPGDGRVRAVARAEVSGTGIIAGEAPNDRGTEVVERNGRPALAHVLHVPVTFIRPGTAVVNVTAQAYSFTRDALNNGAAFQPTSLPATPLRAVVQRLPEPALPGFTGGIGRFILAEPELSTNRLAAGTPLTLTVTLDGERAARVPPPPAPRDDLWQVVPQPLPSAGPGPAPEGPATFTFVLVPRSASATNTPAIPFATFDPTLGRYVDLTLPPRPVVVTGDTAGAAVFQAPPVAPSDAATPAREPRLTPPSTTPGTALTSLSPVSLHRQFLAAQALPALILGGLVLRERRRRFYLVHPEVVARRRARAGLRRERRRLHRAARKGDTAAWTEAAVNALREACAPFAGGHATALVLNDVLPVLPGAEDTVRAVFEAQDRARFSSPSVEPDATLLELAPQLEALLRKLRERL